MPKVKRSSKRAPDGFDEISDKLNEFERKMRDAESAGHEGKRKTESVWPIFRIHHQRSRYVYDLYYKDEVISRELYEYLLEEGYADSGLIAKWKKQGFENLCCVKCISSKEHTHGTTCICRVPRNDLDPGKIVECVQCGCRGCSSGDGKPNKEDHPAINNNSSSSSSSSSIGGPPPALDPAILMKMIESMKAAQELKK